MKVVPLRSRELRVLLATLDWLYEPVKPAEFPARFFAAFAELIPGCIVSFDFADLRAGGRIESHISPEAAEASSRPLVDLEAAVAATLWQHPAMHHLTHVDPVSVTRPTDFVSLRQFRATEFWHECHQPLRLQHQIIAGMAWPGHAGGFTVNRSGSRDFSDREEELVRRLRPHVQTAFVHSVRLADLDSRLATFRQANPGAAGAADFTAKQLLTHRLTRREAEILRWLAEGKRDAEIATILGLSPRTVQNHVSHILAKLGTETRTAAAATAYHWLAEG